MEIVNQLFDWYRCFSTNLKVIPTLKELERFFTPDFHVVSNGVEVCTSREEYLSHFITLRNRCISATTSPFSEAPIISEDKVVVRYCADVEEQSGRKTQFQIIAILTIKGGKIAKWVEVLNETNPIYWE